MNKQIIQVDSDTGEEVQGCMVWIPYRPKIDAEVVYGIPGQF